MSFQAINCPIEVTYKPSELIIKAGLPVIKGIKNKSSQFNNARVKNSPSNIISEESRLIVPRVEIIDKNIIVKLVKTAVTKKIVNG
jgi:GDP-D-mannose dehydratase